MYVQYPERSLPVLREVDIALVGGSLSGVAAALRLAREGRSILLIEPRTYLGRDITATLRPWILMPAQSSGPALPEPISAILDAHDADVAGNGNEIPLRPDAIKLALEDALFEAGVDLLYASLPVGCAGTPDGRIALVIGNKSGRQVIRCQTIIDATETASVARVTGGTFADWPTGRSRFSRTLEFDRAQPVEAASLAVPDDLGITGNTARPHQGYRGPGHVLVECALDLPYTPDVRGAVSVETESRRRTMALAVWLVESRPELTDARYAGSSHELHGRWTPPLAVPPPAWSGVAAGVDVRLDSDAVAIPLASFAGPHPNVWCLSEAARLDGGQAKRLLDPIRASRLGAQFAAALLKISESRHVPVIQPRVTQPSCEVVAVEIREPDSPQRGRDYERTTVEGSAVPVYRSADVLVVGGGSSGATAAIIAAREGMRTVLLDMNPGLGGTGTYGGVDSYWYGRHVGFAANLERRVQAAQERLHHTGGKWNIDAKTHVLLESAADAGVECLFHTVAIGALLEGSRVCGVTAATRWGVVALLGEVVIDTTGDGDVAAFAGAEFTYGAERTHSVMWYSLAQHTSPGLIRNNFTSTVDVSNIEDYTRAILAGRRRGDGMHDHGIYVATRESRHVHGGVVMTLTDQLRRRQWPDVINIHYSNHDIKGQAESRWLRSGLIPPNLEVEIPYRLVLPEGLDGILVAGKAISVTHDALPAVRMQADLENLGGVVALAAAQAIRERTEPRHIDLERLQRRLVDEGLLPQAVIDRRVVPQAYTDEELEALVESLTGQEPLYSYSDMHMGELFDEPIPFVEICSASERAVPVLERAHEGAEGSRRILLAQALAICGSRTGVPTLIEAVDRATANEDLPARNSSIRHAGFPPDQGAMPDLAYVLFSLGMVPDRRSLPVWERISTLLRPTEENLRHRFAGTFHYVEAICHAAERSRDPEMIPLLTRLRTHAPLRDQVCRDGVQPDFFKERQAMLELGIASALAHCGGSDGYGVLVAYLDDVRALLAERAHSELIALTDQDFGKNGEAWQRWMSTHRPANDAFQTVRG